MALQVFIDRILGIAREGELPAQAGQSGKVLQTNGTTVSWQTSGGGSSLSPSYHLIDYSVSTTYSGINSSSSSQTDANWSITKLVLSGNNREVRTVYTATDQWTNRSTATYSTSLTYSN